MKQEYVNAKNNDAYEAWEAKVIKHIRLLLNKSTMVHRLFEEDFISSQSAELLLSTQTNYIPTTPTVEPSREAVGVEEGENWELDDSKVGISLWQDSRRDEGICLATIYTEAPNWRSVADLILSAPQLKRENEAMKSILKTVRFWFDNEANYPEGTGGYKIVQEINAILKPSKPQ